MKFAVFLSVSSIIAVVTVLIGPDLIGAPNWHFTFLDVVADVAGGVSFGLFAHAMSTFLTPPRTGLQAGIAALLVVAGILTVLTLEGGAARALIFRA